MTTRLALALLAVSTLLLPASARAKGKVYISADMEGIAGVVTGEQLGLDGQIKLVRTP